MNTLICQINAIARLCVTWTGDEEYSTAELLSIRQAFAEALDTVDDELRRRRHVLSERFGRHAEETA